MKITTSIFIGTILTLPFFVSAQTSYTPLVQIFGESTTSGTWQQYIDLLYATAISLAALLAVIKIVIAGVKYMFSDVITNKSEAKKDIQGALLGLLLIMAAVLVLELINPRLSNIDIVIPKAANPNPLPAGIGGSGAAPVAATNPDGSAKTPLVQSNIGTSLGDGNRVGCYGNWCLDPKYATWEGSTYVYNADSHCTDVAAGGSFTKEACLAGVGRAMGSSNTDSGYCRVNAATQITSRGGSLACQLPTSAQNSAYFENKFNEAQEGRAAGDVALSGADTYNAKEDYKTMCAAEVVNGQNGRLVSTDSDWLTYSAEKYKCVWY